MKAYLFLICCLGTLIACQSSEKSSPDTSLKAGKQNYTIIDFDSLPEATRQKMIDILFISQEKSMRFSEQTSISDARDFINKYSAFIDSTTFLKQNPDNPNELAEIPLRKIIHSNICPSCSTSFPFPSYSVDVDNLHNHVVKNRGGMYKNVKDLRLYPAIRVEGGRRIFTMVLVGLDANKKIVLNRRIPQTDNNFILEYIEPCTTCPNVE